jgi:hypothetical protein
MDFDFKETSLERIFYVLAYPMIAAFVIANIVMPSIGLVDWSHIWNVVNAK